MIDKIEYLSDTLDIIDMLSQQLYTLQSIGNNIFDNKIKAMIIELKAIVKAIKHNDIEAAEFSQDIFNKMLAIYHKELKYLNNVEN